MRVQKHRISFDSARQHFPIRLKNCVTVSSNRKLKALANEDTLLPTQMFPRLPARATSVFVSATNVSQFAQPKKHHGQQCVRNNVSSFTRASNGQTEAGMAM